MILITERKEIAEYDAQYLPVHTCGRSRILPDPCPPADSHTKKDQESFIRSFLYYVPYVTLSVMTFPAIITAPTLPLAGILALTAGVAAAWKGLNMMEIAALCCAVVFVCEMAAPYLM